MKLSEFDRLGGKVFLDHHGDLEGDGVIKLTEVKSRQLTDLFKSVNKRISVDEELSRCLGNIEIVLEEALNGEQGLPVKCLDASLLEHLGEEHLAKSGRELIYKSADAEVFVAYDILFGIEHLSDLDGDLCLLVGAGKILDALDSGTDTDGYLCIELGPEGVGDRLSDLFDSSCVIVRLDFLDKHDIAFTDAYYIVLVLVGEHILNHLVRDDLVLSDELDKHYDAHDIVAEVKLLGLEVDVARKNVVKYNILYKRSLVVFVVVKPLDAAEGDGEDRGKSFSLLVLALDKDNIFCLCARNRSACMYSRRT